MAFWGLLFSVKSNWKWTKYPALITLSPDFSFTITHLAPSSLYNSDSVSNINTNTCTSFYYLNNTHFSLPNYYIIMNMTHNNYYHNIYRKNVTPLND